MNCLTTAWTAHESELRGWLRHRVGNAALADDLLQDLFLKALRQGERFCAVENARAWLFEVARNTLADHLRVAHQMVELPDDLVAPVEDADTVDTLTACLPRVLSELSPDDREAITLVRPARHAPSRLCQSQRLEPERRQIPPATRPAAFARPDEPGLPGTGGRQRPCERLCAAPFALNTLYC